MEGGAGSVASLTMDCEDMFKEITKKLYGEEAAVGVGVGGVEFPAAERERELDEELRPEEHITAWGLAALMQNGFPPPGILQANFTPRTDPTAEDRWTAAEEPLAWAHSRVAAYNPAQRLFKCAECECVGFLARVAEHWLGTHSQARAFQCPLPGCAFAAGWARSVRQHLARDHHSDPAAADHLLRENPALDDLTRYLQRLKAKVEALRLERRSDPDPEPEPQPEPASAPPADDAGKRYACQACPYATDRRDLFTRHENIHRDEKPFHCYLCQKQFNRADHVKKHFLRMHRDQPYDLNRIRRQAPKPQPQPQPAPAPPPALYYSKPSGEPPPAPAPAPAPAPVMPTLMPAPAQGQHQVEYRSAPPPPLVKQERVQLKAEPTPHKPPPPAPPPAAAAAAATPPRRKGERRYACCYCAWSGVDNWCLKRHLNTHLKPFACALCEYKAARAERLATHVHKVHNKKACGKCAFLADDLHQLAVHLRDAHHIESRNLKVPTTSVPRGAPPPAAGAAPAPAGFAVPAHHQQHAGGGAEAGGAGVVRRREARAAGAARLFGYLEASDGSGDEYEAAAALAAEYAGGAPPGAGPSLPPPAPPPPPPASSHYTRDKENAAPLLHDHCLRY